MIFTHKQYTGRRQYSECTQVVACDAPVAPNENWEPAADPAIINRLSPLWREGETKYYGYM